MTPKERESGAGNNHTPKSSFSQIYLHNGVTVMALSPTLVTRKKLFDCGWDRTEPGRPASRMTQAGFFGPLRSVHANPGSLPPPKEKTSRPPLLSAQPTLQPSERRDDWGAGFSAARGCNPVSPSTARRDNKTVRQESASLSSCTSRGGSCVSVVVKGQAEC